MRRLLLALAPALALVSGPATAQESLAPEVRAALGAFEAFTRLRAEDPAAAVEMLHPDGRAETGDATLVARWFDAGDRAGRPQRVRVSDVLQQDADPARVAVFWQATFTEAHWGCGIQLWDVSGETPLMRREILGFVPLAELEAASPEECVAIAERLGCTGAAPAE